MRSQILIHCRFKNARSWIPTLCRLILRVYQYARRCVELAFETYCSIKLHVSALSDSEASRKPLNGSTFNDAFQTKNSGGEIGLRLTYKSREESRRQLVNWTATFCVDRVTIKNWQNACGAMCLFMFGRSDIYMGK